MRPVLSSALALLGLVSLATPALADAWDKHGEDCDKTAFKSPDTADLSEISRCVKLWEAYQNVSKVKGDYKDRVVTAMKRMYVAGEETDSKIARGALLRLGVSDLPDRSGGGKATASAGTKTATAKAAPKRTPFNPPPPDKGEVKSAEKYFKKGIGAYKKKKYDDALTSYLKMTEVAPGYAKGHYNVACIYALQGNEAKMAEYLTNLADMSGNGNDEAKGMLRQARDDADFAEIRDKSSEFKRLTGYGKIKVLNAMGDRGEENVDNLESSLKKLGHPVDDISPSTKTRKNPIVWYAEHSKGLAYVIVKLLNHPKTQTVLFTPEELKGYDVVVVWGDDLKDKEDPKTYVSDPKDAEKKIDSLLREEDEMLSKPGEAVDEVDDTLSTPDRISDKVEDKVDKAGKSVDKVEKAIDKAGGLFK